MNRPKYQEFGHTTAYRMPIKKGKLRPYIEPRSITWCSHNWQEREDELPTITHLTTGFGYAFCHMGVGHLTPNLIDHMIKAPIFPWHVCCVVVWPSIFVNHIHHLMFWTGSRRLIVVRCRWLPQQFVWDTYRGCAWCSCYNFASRKRFVGVQLCPGVMVVLSWTDVIKAHLTRLGQHRFSGVAC
jgi:hypothetical protein